MWNAGDVDRHTEGDKLLNVLFRSQHTSLLQEFDSTRAPSIAQEAGCSLSTDSDGGCAVLVGGSGAKGIRRIYPEHSQTMLVPNGTTHAAYFHAVEVVWFLAPPEVVEAPAVKKTVLCTKAGLLALAANALLTPKTRMPCRF